jgi:hypothetical protein
MLGDGEKPTDIQIKTVKELRQWLHSKGNSDKVFGHRDITQTDCPGDLLYAMVKNGTFSGNDVPVSSSEEADDPLIGLKKGDEGQAVKALQLLCGFAGRNKNIMDAGGIDGVYGDATAEDLRLVRKDAGSDAKAHYGDKVDGWAYAQLLKQVAVNQAKTVE